MKAGLISFVLLFVWTCFASEDIVDFAKSSIATKANLTEITFDFVIKPGWHVWADKLNDAYLIPTKLEILNPTNLKVVSIVYPVGVKKALMGLEENLFEERNVVRVQVERQGTGPAGFVARLHYQGCNDKTCLPPTQKEVSVSWDGANEPSGGLGEKLGRYGLWTALLFLFLAGLGLNLTPCVYPVIPVTLSFFAGQSGASRSRTAGLSALYVLGIALTYSALGTFAALSGQIMGTLLQHPVVIAGIALVFVLLALSMFGLFEIRPPSFLMEKGMGRQGFLGALAMGLIVGVVVAPCVGPVTAGLLVHVAERKDPFLGFLYFFVLSLGLGLPYFLLGLFSGSIKRLPGSGGWMIWIKKFFGLLLFIMALYYSKPLLPEWISQWLLFLLLVGGAVYLGVFEKSAGTRFPRFKMFQRVFAALLIFSAFLYFKGLPPLTFSHSPAKAHHSMSVSEYQAALQSGRPFVVDFRAEWCAPCREFEKITLADSAVQVALQGIGMHTVDLTDEDDPESKMLVRKLHVVGVPTIIFYSKDGNELLRETRLMETWEFLRGIKRLKGEGQ